MPQPKDDLSRSVVALDQNNTLIAVLELSSSTWLVGGMIPGIERDRLKKLVPDKKPSSTCCIAGVMKPLRSAVGSRALSSPSKPAATAFGWRVGYAPTGSKRM